MNRPRPLFTEKAYPEDEYVVTVVASEGAVTNKFVYEQRIAARSQFEVVVPVALSEQSSNDWTGGVGDLAFAFSVRAGTTRLRQPAGRQLGAEAPFTVEATLWYQRVSYR